LKSFTLADPIQRSLLSLSARGISVFSPHTSLDATPRGINHWLVQPFAPETSSGKAISDSTQIEGFEGAGVGRRIELNEALDIGEIVKRVKKHLGLEHGALVLDIC
jgi:putative NIF3 family GTP cyclohydrolase 1 type 2